MSAGHSFGSERNLYLDMSNWKTRIRIDKACVQRTRAS